MPRQKTIAIDFDGVIHGYSQGWSDGSIYDPPVEGTKEALENLKSEGYRIYIFTTRTNKIFRKKNDPDQLPLIKEYLEMHRLPYDKIWTYGKPMADVYLDDRAVPFSGNWSEAVDQIKNFETWIEKKKNKS